MVTLSLRPRGPVRWPLLQTRGDKRAQQAAEQNHSPHIRERGGGAAGVPTGPRPQGPNTSQAPPLKDNTTSP